ncbi:MAG: radical SAM protein [bacterium]
MSERPHDPERDDRRNVEINVGKVCNSHCVFCLDGLSSRAQQAPMPYDEMRAEIRRWAEQGHRSVGFLGGEPTIYPQIVNAVAYAREQGYTRITLATNGRRLHRVDFTDALLAAGLTRVTISMHSHTAALEDRLTRVPGTYQKKVDAIRLLLRRQAEGQLRDGVSVNLVLNAWNYKPLLRIQKFFFTELGLRDLRINFIRAEGNAEGSRELTPRFAEVVSNLMKAVALNEAHYRHTLTFGGFPMCVLPKSFLNDPGLVRQYMGEYRDMATDCSIRSEGNFGRVTVEDGRARFNWQERKRHDLKSRVDACGQCTVAHLCEGVWNAYLTLYGGADFEPVGPVALVADEG